jgi:hypothetical protein
MSTARSYFEAELILLNHADSETGLTFASALALVALRQLHRDRLKEHLAQSTVPATMTNGTLAIAFRFHRKHANGITIGTLHGSTSYVRFRNQATADRKREKTIPMKLNGVVPELGTEPQGLSHTGQGR